MAEKVDENLLKTKGISVTQAIPVCGSYAQQSSH